MLPLVGLAVAAALPPPDKVPDIVGGLAGCWRVAGQVRGKDATSVARGSWHLERRYFLLQLRSVVAGSPYEAAIYYGAGDKPGGVGSIWMDTFGGLYQPSLGIGATNKDGFSLDYRFPDSVYTNGFVRSRKGWRWSIVESAAGKPVKLFAEYKLAPTSCRGISFGF